MNWLAATIIERAKRTPYAHLWHADGTPYMERFWLLPYSDDRRRYAARVHHIASADYDRELHDHPWDFWSVVLSGGYTEARPVNPLKLDFMQGYENCRYTERRAGSIAFRRATDRHRIVHVEPNTWTLFITGPQRQWWGFYTPTGKVHWSAFTSVHAAA